jgi:hypothetical protein
MIGRFVRYYTKSARPPKLSVLLHRPNFARCGGEAAPDAICARLRYVHQ